MKATSDKVRYDAIRIYFHDVLKPLKQLKMLAEMLTTVEDEREKIELLHEAEKIIAAFPSECEKWSDYISKMNRSEKELVSEVTRRIPDIYTTIKNDLVNVDEGELKGQLALHVSQLDSITLRILSSISAGK